MVSSRDPRMRTVRVDDGLRIVLLAPDHGSDLFVFVHVVSHDKAYSWAKRRLAGRVSSSTGCGRRGRPARQECGERALAPRVVCEPSQWP